MSELDTVKDSVTLQKFEEHHKNIHATGGQTANESDEDEDGEGQEKVGCQQQ